jgi:hypothetical protein
MLGKADSAVSFKGGYAKPKKAKLGAQSSVAKLLAAAQHAQLDESDEDAEDDDDDGEDEDGLYGSTKRERLPFEISEKEPGRLYHDFVVKVNRLHRSAPGAEACIFAHTMQSVKPNLNAKSSQRGLRELLKLSMALDSLTDFCGLLVSSGKFTQKQVHQMATLMKTGDILAQRYKVVEDVELKLLQEYANEKDKPKASVLWVRAQESELIPNTGAGIMTPQEQRAATKNARAKGLFDLK